MEELCSRCKGIDFDDLFDNTDYLGIPFEGQHKVDLGSYAHIEISPTCVFCKLLVQMCKPQWVSQCEHEHEHQKVQYHIRRFCARKIYLSPDEHLFLKHGAGISLNYDASPVIALLSTECDPEYTPIYGYNFVGFIGRSKAGLREPSNRLEIREVRSNEINFVTIRAWIDFCKKYHEEECNSENHHQRDLKLIDCETGKVINAPENISYIALSYVWGQPSLTPHILVNETLPQRLPQTIEDSINAVKELGYRYLWIDKYCINQNDEAEKRRNIAQMDLVYSNADITFMAVAGSNPFFGRRGWAALIETLSLWQESETMFLFPR
jgi:hypothetical protein